MKPLSTRQTQVFNLMADFYAENDQIPPNAVISQHLGTALNNAYGVCLILEKKGYIERNAVGKYRFTALGRTLAANQIISSGNARWPLLGAKLLDEGSDRPVGIGGCTRETTKLHQQNTEDFH